LTPRGGLLEYCIDSRHLAAHRATTSSSRATFNFRLFLGPPRLLPEANISKWLYSTNFPKTGFIPEDIPPFIHTTSGDCGLKKTEIFENEEHGGGEGG